MEITLTPEQESLIQHAIDSGRLKRPEDAVTKALAMWVERERSLIELQKALDEGEADFAAGRFFELDEESGRKLAEQIKREGRALRAEAAHKAGIR